MDATADCRLKKEANVQNLWIMGDDQCGGRWMCRFVGWANRVVPGEEGGHLYGIGRGQG